VRARALPRRGTVSVMPTNWTLDELLQELRRYERELREAGDKAEVTIRTYVDHPERFLRWLGGRYDPQGRL
jgi:hypothetical protein